MFKVLEQIGGNWIERDGAAVFHREATNDGGGRLRVSVPRDEAFLLFKLVECLRPPFQPLYAANAVGLSRGFAALDGRHQHHYRREFDREAAEVLSSFNRSWTPLHPKEHQLVPPVSEWLAAKSSCVRQVQQIDHGDGAS